MVTETKLVRDGYKLTELGEIPDEWKVYTLGDIAHKILDGTHTTPTYTEEGIPFYSVENITNNNFSNTKFVSEEDHLIYSKRCPLEKDDILMTRIGKIGVPKLIDWEVNASIYVSLALIKIDKDIVIPRYLYQFMKSNIFVSEALKRSLLQAAPPKINLGDIQSIPIILPKSKKEQQQISEILSTIDEHIENTDKLIDKTKELKKGLMQQLLTKGIRHKKFKQTELGEIPFEWDIKLLEEKVEILDGMRRPIKKADRVAGNIPYYGATGIIDWVNDYLFEESLILIGEDGENLRSRVLPMAFKIEGKSWVNNHAHVVRPNSDIDIDYLTYYLESIDYDDYITGSAQPKLNQSQLRKIKVVFPSLIEQQKIAEILSSVDDQIDSYEQEKAKYTELKKGLMQQLLTGKIRVTV